MAAVKLFPPRFALLGLDLASKKGDLEIVQALLSDNPSVPKRRLKSAVKHATAGGYLEIIEELLKKSENALAEQQPLDRLNKILRMVAIHSAIKNGHPEIAETFLKERLPLSKKERKAFLMTNGIENYPKIIEELFKDRLPVSLFVRREIFEKAVSIGNGETLQKLDEYNPIIPEEYQESLPDPWLDDDDDEEDNEVNDFLPLSHTDWNLALRIGAEKGHLATVREALKHIPPDAEIRAPALSDASFYDHLPIIQELLETSTAIPHRTLELSLHNVASGGHLKLTQELLKKDPSSESIQEAFDAVLRLNRTSVIERLKERLYPSEKSFWE